MESISIDIQGTSQNLKRMLEERKISAKEVQRALKIKSPQAVYKWISINNQTLPSLENLIQLASLLNCSIEDILVIRGGKMRTGGEKQWICKKCGSIMEDVSNRRLLKNSFMLGEYWQGIDRDYGKSPIEWIVLKEFEDGRILVISSEVLDCQKYEEEFEEYLMTWENCSLRKWLNTTFLNDAFSPKDQEKILEVTNKTEDNAKFGASGGADTSDKIFLLSLEEVNRYFLLDEYFSTSTCYATKYARARGVEVSREGCCKWWLRTPGLQEYGRSPQETYIDCRGQVKLFGYDMRFSFVGVRPAMMIDRNKLEW